MTLIKVPLNDIHEQLGAKMVPFAGFSMPLRYSSDIEEHNTVRNQVGVFDVSHMGEFFVRGEKALDLIQYVSSNDASKLENGKAQYSCLPNEEGGIVDDLLVYKIQEQEYMLVVNAANIEKDWNWIQKFNTDGVEMENASDQICLLAIQGPNAKQTLQKLTPIDLDSIKFYHFVTGKMADVEGVIISATGYTGEPGFELYFDKKYADQIWNKIFEAGKPHGIKPIGLGARDTLRLEMGLCLYGNDIDDHTSPFEAGLGWITKFTKDFVNADSLKKQKENGVDKKLVGFVMEDKGIPRKGYEIMDEADQVIGHVTSGAQSPTLKQGIGMGYVAKEYSKPSSEIFISVRKRRLKAKVVKPPMIKK